MEFASWHIFLRCYDRYWLCCLFIRTSCSLVDNWFQRSAFAPSLASVPWSGIHPRHGRVFLATQHGRAWFLQKIVHEECQNSLRPGPSSLLALFTRHFTNVVHLWLYHVCPSLPLYFHDANFYDSYPVSRSVPDVLMDYLNSSLFQFGIYSSTVVDKWAFFSPYTCMF